MSFNLGRGTRDDLDIWNTAESIDTRVYVVDSCFLSLGRSLKCCWVLDVRCAVRTDVRVLKFAFLLESNCEERRTVCSDDKTEIFRVYK